MRKRQETDLRRKGQNAYWMKSGSCKPQHNSFPVKPVLFDLLPDMPAPAMNRCIGVLLLKPKQVFSHASFSTRLIPVFVGELLLGGFLVRGGRDAPVCWSVAWR